MQSLHHLMAQLGARRPGVGGVGGPELGAQFVDEREQPHRGLGLVVLAGLASLVVIMTGDQFHELRWPVILCFVAMLVGIAGFAFILERRQAWEAAPRIVTDVAKLPEMDVALVLGTGPYTYRRDGSVTTNVPFGYRLDAAAELFRAGKVKYLIVSGRRDGAYDEPTAMRAGLVARGVPADAIYRDFGGVRTYDRHGWCGRITAEIFGYPLQYLQFFRHLRQHRPIRI